MKLTSRLELVSVALAAAALHCPPVVRAQCASDELPNIVGAWEWIDTSGGFAGDVFTPSGVGYEIQMEFLDTGTLLVYQNSELVVVTTYALESGLGGWTVVVDASSKFPHPPIQYRTDFFCVSTQDSSEGLLLRADDACDDCYRSVYVSRDPVGVSPSPWGAVKSLYRQE